MDVGNRESRRLKVNLLKSFYVWVHIFISLTSYKLANGAQIGDQQEAEALE